tara:strand:- start:2004 stop:3533 length:1530 start_codon:yes stop_codon:yes gene_type:complete
MVKSDLAQMVGISAQESQSQRVETRLIEPRSFSQSQATFELPQEGILSDDIALQLQLTTSQTNGDQRNDLPLMAGILGCLDRVEMFFGTTLINAVENCPHLMQMKNCLIDQDIRDQTHNVYLGSFSGLKTRKGTGANAWGKMALNSKNIIPAGGIQASQGVLGILDTTATETNKLDHFRTQALESDTPFWTIKLKDIFPVLSQIPLPLFALKERVRFVFHFSADLAGNRCTAGNTAAGGGATPFTTGNTIIQSSCKLSTDLIYYEDQVGVPSPMLRIQQELEKGVSLVMTDYVNIISTLPAKAVPAGQTAEQPLSILLGLDHQIVRNILIATPSVPDFGVAPTTPANRLLGNYLSKASNVGTTLQIGINNENVFPSALNTTSKLYNEFSQIEDVPLKVNRGLFSADGQTSGTGGYLLDVNQQAFDPTYFMHGVPQSELNYSLNYLGVNLSKDAGMNYVGNGTQIGRQPVIVTINRTRSPEDVGQLRVLVWAEVERMMMIKSGNIFMSGQ